MSNIVSNLFHKRVAKLAMLLFVGAGLFYVMDAHAADNAGTIAKNVTDTFANLAKLITATAYIAGLGFAIGAILKFKQHKDNPTNIPIGTPIAMLFIAAALIFLPTIFGVTGATLFGNTGGTVGGVSGMIFS